MKGEGVGAKTGASGAGDGKGLQDSGDLRTAEMETEPRAGGRVLTPTSLSSHPGLSVCLGDL